MGAYLSRPDTKKESEDGGDAHVATRFGLTAMQGWRQTMEDAHIAIPSVPALTGRLDRDVGLYGVFDGHGGPSVSEWISRHLPNVLDQTIQDLLREVENQNIPTNTDKDLPREVILVAEALQRTFLRLDDQMQTVGNRQEIKEIHMERAKQGQQNGEHQEGGPPRSLLQAFLSAGCGTAPTIKWVHQNGEHFFQISAPNEEEEEEEEEEDGNRVVVQEVDASEMDSDKAGDSKAGDSKAADSKTGDSKAGDSKPGDSKAGDSKSGVSKPGDSKSSGDSEAGDSKAGDSKAGDGIPDKAVMSDDKPVAERLLPERAESTIDLAKTEEDDKADMDDVAPSKKEDKPQAEKSDKAAKESSPSSDEDTTMASGEDVRNETKTDSSKSEPAKDSSSESAKEWRNNETRMEDGKEDDMAEPAEQDLDDDFGTQNWKPEHCGAAVVVAAVVGGENPHLIVANAGDSRCVLCRGGKAIAMSEDHKPGMLAENARITKAGGHVRQGRVDGNLNLSRTLGDLCYKKDKNLPPTEQKITAFPDIRIIPVTKEDEFVIVACDGIWDCVSNQEACDFVRGRLGLNPDETRLSLICEELCDECLANNPMESEGGIGCDNMTAIIVMLNQPIKEKARAPTVEANMRVFNNSVLPSVVEKH